MPAGMATGRHGLAGSIAVSRYLQRYLNDWLERQRAEGHPVPKADLARTIGISAAHVTNITKNGRGVGPDVEESLARWMNVTIDELRASARAEFKEEPEPLVFQAEDRYANRARALEFMTPESSAEARERVQSIDLKSDVDPPASWWVREIERAEQIVRMERARPDLAQQRAAEAAARGAELEDATRPKRRAKT